MIKKQKGQLYILAARSAKKIRKRLTAPTNSKISNYLEIIPKEYMYEM